MATKFINRDYLTSSFRSFKTVVLDPLFGKKLDNATDVENAGKAVVVDDDGNLVFENIKTEISLEAGNKIESKTDGIFVGSDDAKVDVAQGEDNKGLALIVGEDGNVTLGEAGVQVSEEEGNKIEKLDDGIYVADTPDAWTGTKAEFEALDKSTLKDKQQVEITDDFGESIIVDSEPLGNAAYSGAKTQELIDEISDSLVDLESALEDKADADKVVPLTYKTTVTNANDLPDGFISASGLTNAPQAGYIFYRTFSYDGNSDYRVQEATLIGTTRKLIRYKNQGTWESWQELATMNSIVAETKSFTLNAKYGTPTQWTCNVAKSGYKVIGVTFEHGYSAQIVMAVETWGNDVLKGYAQLALSASEINITAYAHIIYQKI